MSVLRSNGRRLIGLAPLLLLVLLAAACGKEEGLPGEGKTVQAALSASGSDRYQTEIYVLALQELGYETKPHVTLTFPEHYQAVSAGEVDFWTNGLFEDHQSYLVNVNVGLDRNKEKGAQRMGYLAEDGALQGYLIDKKTADEHNITSLADFKKPEIVGLFDTDGDGKADMVGCPQNGPNGDCQKVITHHMDAYELTESVDVLNRDYAAAMRDVIARHEQGEPVFFYTWTPNWTVAKLVPGRDVVWLEVPFGTLPGPGRVEAVKGVPGCVNDPCLMGFPANDIRVVANMQFMRENSNVRRLFLSIAIPSEDISAQQARMLDGENADEDIIRHAGDWVQANRALFDSWIEEALKKRSLTRPSKED